MKYLYRIVNALLALSIFPAIIFLDFVYIRVATTVVEAGLHETFTMIDIIDIIRGDHFYASLIPEGTTFTWPEALNPLNARLITCGVCFALIIVVALFIFVWSICSNKRIPVVIASAVGFISVIVMICCFNSAADAITSGAIDIIKAFSSGFLMSLVSGFINVEMITLAGFQNGLIIIFVMLLVWTGAYYLVEIGEPKEEEKTKKKH